MQIEYTWDDILIIGDSFCANRDAADTWPQQVLAQLTGDSSRPARGRGFTGGAWWSYRKTLIEELKGKPPQVLIVCHTEPFRIPNDQDYGLNLKSVEDRVLHSGKKNSTMPANLAKAGTLFYQELFCEDFYLWATRQWFMELDWLCAEYDIKKVIHLYAFDGNYSDYTFANGVTISTPLSSYAEQAEPIFWRFKWKLANHYTRKGNAAFANSIVGLIKNYPGAGTRLDMKLIDYGNSTDTQ